MGFDYYDSEIIAAVTASSGVDAQYVSQALRDRDWRHSPLTHRRSISTGKYFQSNQIDLLLQQKKVIEGIGAHGKDCVMVGRDADVILSAHRPFAFFVRADIETKVRRYMARAPEGESQSEKAQLRKMKGINKARARTREMLNGSVWGKHDAHCITVNTGGWDVPDLVPAVVHFAMRWFERNI